MRPSICLEMLRGYDEARQTLSLCRYPVLLMKSIFLIAWVLRVVRPNAAHWAAAAERSDVCESNQDTLRMWTKGVIAGQVLPSGLQLNKWDWSMIGFASALFFPTLHLHKLFSLSGAFDLFPYFISWIRLFQMFLCFCRGFVIVVLAKKSTNLRLKMSNLAILTIFALNPLFC